jgi:hypothetical protein
MSLALLPSLSQAEQKRSLTKTYAKYARTNCSPHWIQFWNKGAFMPIWKLPLSQQLQRIRNKAFEDAASQAELRAKVFGGEPTTRNEQQIVEHIAAAIRSLKS